MDLLAWGKNANHYSTVQPYFIIKILKIIQRLCVHVRKWFDKLSAYLYFWCSPHVENLSVTSQVVSMCQALKLIHHLEVMWGYSLIGSAACCAWNTSQFNGVIKDLYWTQFFSVRARNDPWKKGQMAANATLFHPKRQLIDSYIHLHILDQ